MSVPRDLLRENPGLGKWAILHGYRGSIALVGSSLPNQPDADAINDLCVAVVKAAHGAVGPEG